MKSPSFATGTLNSNFHILIYLSLNFSFPSTQTECMPHNGFYGSEHQSHGSAIPNSVLPVSLKSMNSFDSRLVRSSIIRRRSWYWSSSAVTSIRCRPRLFLEYTCSRVRQASYKFMALAFKTRRTIRTIRTLPYAQSDKVMIPQDFNSVNFVTPAHKIIKVIATLNNKNSYSHILMGC